MKKILVALFVIIVVFIVLVIVSKMLYMNGTKMG